MESAVTFQDVANIVLFVIPGYFALKTYTIIYSKRDKEFPRIVLESIAYSLPIVSLYTLGWEFVTDKEPIFASARYVVPLLALSIFVGWLFATLRGLSVFKKLARQFRLPSEADEDFIRAQFSKLGKNDLVTVALRNGDVFAGTPQAGSILRDGASRQYSFNDIFWYDKNKNNWEQSEGSIIIDLGEVLYFETETQLPRE